MQNPDKMLNLSMPIKLSTIIGSHLRSQDFSWPVRKVIGNV